MRVVREQRIQVRALLCDFGQVIYFLKLRVLPNTGVLSTCLLSSCGRSEDVGTIPGNRFGQIGLGSEANTQMYRGTNPGKPGEKSFFKHFAMFTFLSCLLLTFLFKKTFVYWLIYMCMRVGMT